VQRLGTYEGHQHVFAIQAPSPSRRVFYMRHARAPPRRRPPADRPAARSLRSASSDDEIALWESKIRLSSSSDYAPFLESTLADTERKPSVRTS
jgi:hypothetical protein